MVRNDLSEVVRFRAGLTRSQQLWEALRQGRAGQVEAIAGAKALRPGWALHGPGGGRRAAWLRSKKAEFRDGHRELIGLEWPVPSKAFQTCPAI